MTSSQHCLPNRNPLTAVMDDHVQATVTLFACTLMCAHQSLHIRANINCNRSHAVPRTVLCFQLPHRS